MFVVGVVLAIGLSVAAQRTVTVEPAPPVKIRVDELVITGTTTLDSEQLNDIISILTGHEYNDDAVEINERLRDAFQERGYFHPEIKNFKLKPLDPLANPKPVMIEADVNEGPRYRLADIKLEGSKLLTPPQLAAAMPIHPGEYFDVEKVRAGVTALRNLYLKQGYLLAMPVPETREGSDASIVLTFNVDEGPQFRMGSIEFAGDPDVVAQLKSKWQLAAGEQFDGNFLRHFVEQNKGLLPNDFDYMNDAMVDMNCRDGIADVRINADPKHPKMPPTKLVGCDTPPEDDKQAGRTQ